jgi:hypothetical protein
MFSEHTKLIDPNIKTVVNKKELNVQVTNVPESAIPKIKALCFKSDHNIPPMDFFEWRVSTIDDLSQKIKIPGFNKIMRERIGRAHMISNNETHYNPMSSDDNISIGSIAQTLAQMAHIKSLKGKALRYTFKYGMSKPKLLKIRNAEHAEEIAKAREEGETKAREQAEAKAKKLADEQEIKNIEANNYLIQREIDEENAKMFTNGMG